MRWLRSAIEVLGTMMLVVAALVSAGATSSAGAAGASARGARIPPGARVLQVTVRRPHHAPLSDVSATRRATIRRFASLIDGLTPVGPSALDCTGRADDPVVTFTFRAAPGGRVLGRATQIEARGGGLCEPMTLTVNGRPQTPRLGGTGVVRAAQRLLGIRVPRG